MMKDDLLSIDFTYLIDYDFKQAVFHTQFVNKVIISVVISLSIKFRVF